MLPDFRGGVRVDASATSDATPNASDMALWHIRNSDFLNGSKRLLVKDMKIPDGTANQHYMEAEDNSFRSVGYSYKDFVTSAQHMLSFGDKRYWIPSHKLPAEVCRNLGLTGRFCVVRRGSSTTSLEVTHENTDTMGLFQTIDGGSIGWSSKFYLFSTTGACLRGAALHDPCHMRHDHMKTAIASVGLKGIIGDGKVQLCECSGICSRLHTSCCN